MTTYQRRYLNLQTHRLNSKKRFLDKKNPALGFNP